MEMRRECERCHVGLSDDGSAYVCSHECSFCPSCVRTLTFVCPNCSGELVRRPRRSSRGSPGRGAPRSPDPSVTVRRATLADLDSVAQLFDEKYREIPGTNPKQYLTEYLELTDRILPPIQDPLQKIDPRIVYCVAWARGGYLPTHNPNYRLPQGPDPAWNAANCRNRRIFDDRAVRKAAQNRKPFLLQTYRRNMGAGKFALMKDLSSPIFVDGRLWGAFRMGFQ